MWSRRVAAVGYASLAVRQWSHVVLHPPRDPALADTTPETAWRRADTPQMASAPPLPPPPRGPRVPPSPPASAPMARSRSRHQPVRAEVLKEVSILSTLMTEMLRLHEGHAPTPGIEETTGRGAPLPWANPPGKRTRRLARASGSGRPPPAAASTWTTKNDETVAPPEATAVGGGAAGASPPVTAVPRGRPPAAAGNRKGGGDTSVAGGPDLPDARPTPSDGSGGVSGARPSTRSGRVAAPGPAASVAADTVDEGSNSGSNDEQDDGGDVDYEPYHPKRARPGVVAPVGSAKRGRRR